MDHGTEPSGSMPLHSALEDLHLRKLGEKKLEGTPSCAVPVPHGLDEQNPYCARRAWALPSEVGQSSRTVQAGEFLCALPAGAQAQTWLPAEVRGHWVPPEAGQSSPPSWLEW